jgi:hypothetical protein
MDSITLKTRMRKIKITPIIARYLSVLSMEKFLDATSDRFGEVI